MITDPTIQAYVHYLQAQGMSASTLTNYSRTLAKLEVYLCRRGATVPYTWRRMVAEVRDGVVVHVGPLPAKVLLAFLDEEGTGAAATHLRGLFAYLVNARHLQHNPMKGVVHRPAPAYRLEMRGFSEQEFGAMCGAALSGPHPTRDHAMLAVAFGLGPRPGELRRLWLEADAVRVHGKMGERIVPVPPEIRALIATHLQEDDRSGRYGGPPVFLDDRGRPYSARGLQLWFKGVASRAGIRRHVKPYEARHACANFLHWKGIPDAIIAALLGHSVTTLRKHYLQECEPANPSDELVAGAFRASLRLIKGGLDSGPRRAQSST